MSMEDRAQAEEAFQWGLNNRRREPDPEFKPGEDGYGPAMCSNEDCEAPMPELRRRRGRQFCTDCQGVAEAAAKRRY